MIPVVPSGHVVINISHAGYSYAYILHIRLHMSVGLTLKRHYFLSNGSNSAV